MPRKRTKSKEKKRKVKNRAMARYNSTEIFPPNKLQARRKTCEGRLESRDGEKAAKRVFYQVSGTAKKEEKYYRERQTQD